MRSLVVFLRSLTWPGWFCCLLSVAAVCISSYTWWPDIHPTNSLTVWVALSAMGTGLIAFTSVAGHHLISWEHRKGTQPKIRLPGVYWKIAAAAFVYFFALFLGSAVYYPHGVDLGPIVSLRIFGAAAILMGICATGFTQWAGLRVRALQSAP